MTKEQNEAVQRAVDSLTKARDEIDGIELPEAGEEIEAAAETLTGASSQIDDIVTMLEELLPAATEK